MLLFLVFNFSTGGSEDGSQVRRAPGNLSICPHREHICTGCCLKGRWLRKHHLPPQLSCGGCFCRQRGSLQGKWASGLKASVLGSRWILWSYWRCLQHRRTLRHLYCLNAVSSAGVIILLYSSHKILCRTHPSAWTDNKVWRQATAQILFIVPLNQTGQLKTQLSSLWLIFFIK